MTYKHKPSRDARQSLKIDLWEAQGGRCIYCEVDMFYDGWMRKLLARYSKITPAEYAHRVATFEHLRRRTDGGTWERENLALACKRCNCSRGERAVEEHKTEMMRRRARFRAS